MKAMIFAAGLGTRLGPVSRHVPKALTKVGGKPMLQRVAEKLAGAGATTIVVNMHHHPDQIRAFVDGFSLPGVRFILSDETRLLLDTGGGLKKASEWLQGDGPVILHNADVLCDIDLHQMLRHHLAKRALATLAVSDRPSSRYFLWDGQGRLGGWQHAGTGETILCGDQDEKLLKPMAFSGIHILDPAFFGQLTEEGVFPVIKTYLRLAATSPIVCFTHDARHWADIGDPEKLRKARDMFLADPESFGG